MMLPSVLSGADAYIIRFKASGKQALCHQALWSSDVLFYNAKGASSSVRLLGVSNGPLFPGVDTSIPLPPGQVVSIEGPGVNAQWVPVTFTSNSWVIHVDIPDGVVVESRNEVSDDEFCTPEHLFSRGPVGKVSMPVIRQLTPAGVPQVILGTDLVSPGARQNVMIYNASDRQASAEIQVRQACDNTVVDSRAVQVPANTIIQFAGFTNGSDTCPTPVARTHAYVRYTVVTVDQPSFALVSSLTETQIPSQGDVTPIIELAVAINSMF